LCATEAASLRHGNDIPSSAEDPLAHRVPRIRRRFCYDDIAAPDVVSHHRQLLHQHEVSRSIERRQHTRPQAHGDVHTVVVDHVHQATHLESHRTVLDDLTPDVREHSRRGRARHLPLLDARCPWFRQRSRVANGVPDGIPSGEGVEHRVGVHCLGRRKIHRSCAVDLESSRLSGCHTTGEKWLQH